MKTMKKTLCLLLALVMCLSLINLPAFAAGGHPAEIQDSTDKITGDGHAVAIEVVDGTAKCCCKPGSEQNDSYHGWLKKEDGKYYPQVWAPTGQELDFNPTAEGEYVHAFFHNGKKWMGESQPIKFAGSDKLKIEKKADKSTVVVSDDAGNNTITYTVTVTNPTDSYTLATTLTDIFTLDGEPVNGLTMEDFDGHITVPVLAPYESLTYTYSCTVTKDHAGELVNTVQTPDGNSDSAAVKVSEPMPDPEPEDPDKAPDPTYTLKVVYEFYLNDVKQDYLTRTVVNEEKPKNMPYDVVILAALDGYITAQESLLDQTLTENTEIVVKYCKTTSPTPVEPKQVIYQWLPGYGGTAANTPYYTETINEGAAAPTYTGTPTREGFAFKGWSEPVEGTNKDGIKTVTCTARWVETFTVTFDSNGGSAEAGQTVEKNGLAVRPADPTREGYSFDGWTLNGQTYDFTASVTGDITLTAHWTEPTDPEPSDPEPSDPEPTDPEPSDPEPSDPEPSDPEPTDPEPSDPEPTDPEPSDPEPSDPEPSDPEPTEPDPTDPEPTDPEPTDPEPTVPEVTVPEPADPEDPGEEGNDDENTLLVESSDIVDAEEVDIIDEDTPLVENPDTEDADEEEIEDPDTPLVDNPGEEEIGDEDTPLTDVPQTGDFSPVWCAALILSACGLVLLNLKRRKDTEY